LFRAEECVCGEDSGEDSGEENSSVISAIGSDIPNISTSGDAGTPALDVLPVVETCDREGKYPGVSSVSSALSDISTSGDSGVS
jgi:hypothetical protein